MNELLELSRGFFMLQTLLGSANFVYGAFWRSMGHYAIILGPVFASFASQIVGIALYQKWTRPYSVDCDSTNVNKQKMLSNPLNKPELWTPSVVTHGVLVATISDVGSQVFPPLATWQYLCLESTVLETTVLRTTRPSESAPCIGSWERFITSLKLSLVSACEAYFLVV